MPNPVKITAILTARPGKESDLQTLVFALAAHSRSEPGNLRWDIWRDAAEPSRLVLDELYRDQAAAEMHRRTPHFQAYLEKIGGLAERVAITSLPLDVA